MSLYLIITRKEVGITRYISQFWPFLAIFDFYYSVAEHTHAYKESTNNFHKQILEKNDKMLHVWSNLKVMYAWAIVVIMMPALEDKTKNNFSDIMGYSKFKSPMSKKTSWYLSYCQKRTKRKKENMPVQSFYHHSARILLLQLMFQIYSSLMLDLNR